MNMSTPQPRVWPENQPEIPALIAFGYLTAVPILAIFVSRRGTWSLRTIMKWPLVKILVLCTMLDSFLFLWASVFLMERIHLVYSVTQNARLSRWKSPWYRVSFVFFCLWIAVAIVMIVGRISEIRQQDGACVIGLKLFATTPMLTVDALVNVFLTAAFVVPIYKSKFNKARKLARNSSLAATAALITSAANIMVLAIQHGHQLSFVCLGSCGLDVAINSCIIFFITSAGGETDSLNETAQPTNQGETRTDASGSGNGGFPSPPRFMRGKSSMSASTGGVYVCSEIVRSIDQSLDSPLPSTYRRNSSFTLGHAESRRDSIVPFIATRVDLLGSPCSLDDSPSSKEITVFQLPRSSRIDSIDEMPTINYDADEEEKKIAGDSLV